MTRQWLTLPPLMCRRHLLGEHLEAHIFVSKMEKEWSLKGFIDGSMFFGAEFVKTRHDLLARYIRGHKTPLDVSHINKEKYPLLEVTENDVIKSLTDLISRCEECRYLHTEAMQMVNNNEDGIRISN